MLQTAHQSSAHAGNFARIQGKVLLLRHLDGNRNKLGQMAVTAKHSAADADSAQNLRLVAHADLAQLDSRFKNACKVFYQLAEIHTSVRRKIEQNLIVVKGIFRIDQLHFQTVLADFFLTDLKRFFFFCLISGFLLVVALCRHAQHRL